MSAPRPATVDVSGLPTSVYGHRSVVWWATAAFMLIEGTTLVICGVTYLYLRRNFAALPPERVAVPALTAATLNVALMLVSLLPAYLLKKAGQAKRMGAIHVLLPLLLLFTLAFVGLRWWELQQVHVRWDLNAYGSVVWATLIFHGTLLLVEVGEVAVMAAMSFGGPWEEKHFSDMCDIAFYWFFMVLSWLPLYLLVYWLPRWM